MDKLSRALHVVKSLCTACDNIGWLIPRASVDKHDEEGEPRTMMTPALAAVAMNGICIQLSLVAEVLEEELKERGDDLGDQLVEAIKSVKGAAKEPLDKPETQQIKGLQNALDTARAELIDKENLAGTLALANEKLGEHNIELEAKAKSQETAIENLRLQNTELAGRNVFLVNTMYRAVLEVKACKAVPDDLRSMLLQILSLPESS